MTLKEFRTGVLHLVNLALDDIPAEILQVTLQEIGLLLDDVETDGLEDFADDEAEPW